MVKYIVYSVKVTSLTDKVTVQHMHQSRHDRRDLLAVDKPRYWTDCSSDGLRNDRPVGDGASIMCI